MTKINKETKFDCVLLIDDESIDNFINERIITTSFFAKDVVVKISADDGMDYLIQNLDNPPRIIFLDLNMKVHDGFWFLDQFQNIATKHAELKDKCKIIVLSSSISEEEIRKASTNPFVIKYLNKPLSEDYLKAINI